MAMTMPLAPSDMFLEALHQIQLVADRLCDTFPNVLLFMAYLHNVWLPISSKVSVYGFAVATNNIVESFNNTLAQRFQTTRPNLWIFLDNLLKLIKDEFADYERLLRNIKVTRIRTRANREKNAKIKLFQDNLTSGILSIDQFLNLFNKDYEQQHYVNNVLLKDCDESDVYNETRTSETFIGMLPDYISIEDLCTEFVPVESTTIDGIDDDILPTVTDNINICIESQEVPTYNSVEGNDVFICSCEENESCVHLGNRNKGKAIEGKYLITNSILLMFRLCITKLVNFIEFMFNVYLCVLSDISSTSIDKHSDICTKALQELHISVDNMTKNTDFCISGSQINEQHLMEEEGSGRRICCCKSGIARIVLPCGHTYFCK